jgi:PAS domain S-box-containing protein
VLPRQTNITRLNVLRERVYKSRWAFMHTLLYVDDEPALLEIGRTFLEKTKEFTVITLSSAVEALNFLERARVDVVISDYQMPGMDGIAFLKALRTRGDETPFIIFTGKGREEVVIEALNAGADFYLQKGGNPKAQFAELSNKIHYAVSRKRAEYSLAMSEEKYRHLIEHSNEAIVVAQDGMLRLANHRAVEFTGYSEEELLSMPFLEVIYPDDRAMVMDRYLDRLKGVELPSRYAFRLSPKDGSTRWVEISVAVIDWDGRPASLNFLTDITERKRAEEAMRTAEDTYRNIFLNSQIGLFRTDMHTGLILDVNDAVARFIGYQDRVSLLAEPFNIAERYVDPYDREKMISLLQADGEFRNYEARFRKNDGSIIWMRFSARLVREKGWIEGVSEDITEAKRTQEALRIQHDLVMVLNRCTSLKEAFDEILSITVQIEGIDAGGIYIVDPVSGAIDIKAHRGLSPQFLESASHYDHDAPRVQLAKTGEVRYRSYADLRSISDAPQKEEGLRAIVTIPVVHEGEMIALLNMASHTADEIPISTHHILETISMQIGNTLARLRSREALRESEENYRTIYGQSPIAIELYDAAGMLLHANPACLNLFGIEDIQAIRNLSLFADPNISNALKERLHQGETVQYQGPYDFEKVIALNLYPTSRVGILWLDVLITPLGDRADAITGFLVQAQDITGRKRAEDALRESESRYRLLADNSTDVIWTLDINGAFTYVSPSVFQLRGYTSEEVMHQPFHEVISKGSIAIVEETMQQAFEMVKSGVIPAPNVTEVEQPCKDGSSVWTEVVSHLLFDGAGKPAGFIGISRNITERKRAEEAIRQANKKLTLLSGITRHDINNQITVLMGYLTILETMMPDHACNEYFHKVLAAAERISAMIRFTKEYEQIGVHHPAWHDFKTLVDIAAKQAQLGKVMVKNNLPADVEVFADPLIVKVFYNLMDNAVRYGGKITTIRFTVEDHNGDQILVCEDDGDGVPDWEKEKIFERGFGKNTGMGLFLSHEILNISGITIRETGEPGKGARFEIAVPTGAWRIAGKCD